MSVVPRGDPRWLVVCDHASNAVPPGLGDLGLARADLDAHIAWDIGAADAARRVAEALDATLVESGVSRLVFDCNRYPRTPAAVPAVSDGRAIPGNVGLEPLERRRREETFFRAYHREIGRRLDALSDGAAVPALISIHSCTPVWQGVERPWQIGIAWNRDDRMARPVIEALRRDGRFAIGANEPYALDLGEDYTVPEHALRRGLANLQVEFRQDCVSTRADAEGLADVLVGAIRASADAGWWERRIHVPESELTGAR